MYSKNSWDKYSKSDEKNVDSLATSYIDFINNGKNERLVVKESIKLLEEKGFKNIKDVKEFTPGTKLYFVNRNKNVCAYILGKHKLIEGLRVLGAHIDSPRLDLKQNPMYENKGFAYLDTHYYGGVKKYQWVTIPLALVGVVVKKDGSVVDINIGLDENDPVVGISDLLIHLSQEQLTKKASNVIEGENLDVTIGSRSLKDKSVKALLLNELKEKYGIEEEDFLSSEIEVVPASKARFYGIDRSMIAGYGHDDRCCAYTSLRAILDVEEIPEYTSCTILVDKEEIGSVGATGAQSRFFIDTINELLVKTNEYTPIAMGELMLHSKMLSSDVSAGYDPLYVSVYEEKNSCFLGKGIVFNKYTGARGKSGCNDANPEYFAWIRKILDENNVNYQTAELGKVDAGGGGTIAYILGNENMDVVDAGIAVLNMHAPMEVISKADLYEAYQAYKTFLLAK